MNFEAIVVMSKKYNPAAKREKRKTGARKENNQGGKQLKE